MLGSDAGRMMGANLGQRSDGMSEELDALGSTLMGEALDALAAGESFGVLLAVQDAAGVVSSCEFTDDGVEACLKGAYDKVRMLGKDGGTAHKNGGLAAPVRYAIVYEGAVADDNDNYQDALMLEFGERGYRSYSAYSLFSGRGRGNGFVWADPAPAGEVESLL